MDYCLELDSDSDESANDFESVNGDVVNEFNEVDQDKSVSEFEFSKENDNVNNVDDIDDINEKDPDLEIYDNEYSNNKNDDDEDDPKEKEDVFISEYMTKKVENQIKKLIVKPKEKVHFDPSQYSEEIIKYEKGDPMFIAKIKTKIDKRKTVQVVDYFDECVFKLCRVLDMPQLKQGYDKCWPSEKAHYFNTIMHTFETLIENKIGGMSKTIVKRLKKKRKITNPSEFMSTDNKKFCSKNNHIIIYTTTPTLFKESDKIQEPKKRKLNVKKNESRPKRKQ